MPPEERPEATSTPAEHDVRADLKAAFDGWTENNEEALPNSPGAKQFDPPADEAKIDDDPRDDGRPRDEKGRFAKKAEGDEAEPGQGAGDPAEQPPAAETKAEPAATDEQEPDEQAAAASKIEGAPPPGWSIKSKSEWDRLPEHIRADVIKREHEVDNGFAKLREYKPLEPYVEMARQSGTTLDQALERYTGMERLIRQDPVKGLQAIAHNMRIPAEKVLQAFGGAPAAPSHQAGGQNGAGGSHGGNADDPYITEAVAPLLRPLVDKMTSLESAFQQQLTADQQRHVTAAQRVVDEFAQSSEYRYFSDVEGIINDLFEKGMVDRSGDFRADLTKAYDMACRIHPEVNETLINQRLSTTDEERRAAAAQADADSRAKAEAAKRAAVSVKGAPSGAVSSPQGSAGSVREDLRQAWQQHV